MGRSNKISIPPEKIIEQKKQEALKRNYIKYFILKVIIIVIIIIVIFQYIYGITFVEGQSMFPSVKDGDLVIYYRLNSFYEVGDVIQFEKEGQTYISRVVARSGDIVDISEDGELLINNNMQQEEIFFNTYQMDSDITFPYKVENNSVFVLSDYRTSAVDSRVLGSISIDNIHGKIITIFRRRGI